MRASRIMAGAVLATATLGLSATTAVAAPNSGLEVYPKTVRAGHTVTVNTTACGRWAHHARGYATIGKRFTLSRGTHREVLVGQFTVPKRTHSGVYRVTVTCPNHKRVSNTFRVTHRHHMPSGPVHTGIGGGSTSSNSTELAIGGALAAAGLAGGGLMMRRRAVRGNA